MKNLYKFPLTLFLKLLAEAKYTFLSVKFENHYLIIS